MSLNIRISNGSGPSDQEKERVKITLLSYQVAQYDENGEPKWKVLDQRLNNPNFENGIYVKLNSIGLIRKNNYRGCYKITFVFSFGVEIRISEEHSIILETEEITLCSPDEIPIQNESSGSFFH